MTYLTVIPTTAYNRITFTFIVRLYFSKGTNKLFVHTCVRLIFQVLTTFYIFCFTTAHFDFLYEVVTYYSSLLNFYALNSNLHCCIIILIEIYKYCS